MDECHKWKLAYQTLATHSQNEDVLTTSEKEHNYDDTRDPGVRDLHSLADESHDAVSQVMTCFFFLAANTRTFNNLTISFTHW